MSDNAQAVAAAATTSAQQTGQSSSLTNTHEGAAGGNQQAAPAKVEMTSDAFKLRLGEERSAAERALLKKFGVEKPGDIEAKLKKLIELEQANLSEQEKAQARIKELEPAATRVKSLEGILSKSVDREIAALPEQVRAKVLERAGDNLEKRMEYLDLLRDAGMLGGAQQQSSTQSAGNAGAQQQGAAAGTQQQGAGAPLPANTAGGGAPPKPAGTRTKWDEYHDIKSRFGEMAGQIFYQNHRLEIDRSRPADS